MKLPGKLLFGTLLASVTYAACTPPPPPPPPGSSGHYLTAASSSIGTFSVTGTSVNAYGAAGAKISITGENASGSHITIFINPYSGSTGTLAIDSNTGGVYYPSPGAAVQSVSGSIILTATTPNIIGSFNYIATDGNTFTGSFNVAAP